MEESELERWKKNYPVADNFRTYLWKAKDKLLARDELLLEAKRAAARAKVSGAQGWQRCPLTATNKRFLRNTVFSAIRSNQKKSQKPNNDSTKPKMGHYNNGTLKMNSIQRNDRTRSETSQSRNLPDSSKRYNKNKMGNSSLKHPMEDPRSRELNSEISFKKPKCSN